MGVTSKMNEFGEHQKSAEGNNSSFSTSFSDFHPESWQSTQTISTVLVGLLSFMTEECPNAIGGMQMTKMERKKMAKESGAFNKRNAKFCKLFPYLLERM
jgi:ubiquitin-conjugating enzyme E2 J2